LNAKQFYLTLRLTAPARKKQVAAFYRCTLYLVKKNQKLVIGYYDSFNKNHWYSNFQLIAASENLLSEEGKINAGSYCL
jgi:hypothetical protein